MPAGVRETLETAMKDARFYDLHHPWFESRQPATVVTTRARWTGSVQSRRVQQPDQRPDHERRGDQDRDLRVRHVGQAGEHQAGERRGDRQLGE